MSLVTISSKKNTEVQRDTDPAIIRNHFKDGLVFREGTEVGLVSLTINKSNAYEVIAGQNDTFVWRIGDRTFYEQHTVTVAEGSYTGDQLANEIALKVNASTILGNYYGEWTCSYDAEAQSGAGAFTLNYGQKETPAAPNPNTFSVYEGGTPTFTSNSTAQVSITGDGSADDFESDTNPLIITGNKGIFPNEGITTTIIRPQEGYSQADQTTALTLKPTTYTNYANPFAFAITIAATTGTALTNGWELELDFSASGGVNRYWVYLGDGRWGESTNENATANEANSTEFFFYNPTRGLYATAANGGRGAEIVGVGINIKYTDATLMAVTQSNLGYGSTVSGYVRNYLYKGRDNYPANVNADILPDQPSGFDVSLRCVDNTARTGVKFTLAKLIHDNNIEFPDAGWRTPSANVIGFVDIDPTTGFSGLPVVDGGVAPSNWTTFTNKIDHIRIQVKITKVRQVSIIVAHDTAGDGIFVEEQIVRDSAGVGNLFGSTIKEKFFPLRPVLAISRGNQYFGSRYIVKGVFDATEILNPDFEVADANTVLHLREVVSADTFAVPTNAQTLAALFKFGAIYPSDAGGSQPSGFLDPSDFDPAGNINTLLGFNRLYNFAAGNTSNPVVSTSSPTTTVSEPTLSLELPDFNIKGANGNTGDSMRVIAVVPKEELATNQQSGTLHYYPAFPIMIDLNLAQESIFYDLNAILRLPDGRVANDLVNPTEITLLFKEGDESKQMRMMKQQAEMLASMIGNRQSAMIGGIGNGNPLL